MCGIAGFVGEGSEDTLKSMSDALWRRGPDGEGYFIDTKERIFLAHRRLSILDLAGGAQPMWNEDGQVGVVFNGEIYNHAELRHYLQLQGHVFKSDHSDTEVLVHGYEEWGELLPSKLDGMFAFAILDKRINHIFIARDRFGKKPLYYSLDNGFLAFASELSALRKHPKAVKSIDDLGLRKYFAYGFIPAPFTLYKDTHKLPGGHWLLYDYKQQTCRIQQYWKYESEPDDAIIHKSEKLLCEELRTLVTQAVRKRLISDVPLGFFLSGGIDSSIIVATAANMLSSDKLHTFSIGFHEPSFDESTYARQVAEYFKTTHHEDKLAIDSAEAIAADVLEMLDEPMGDASLLPTWMLANFARKYVTVAIGGDGGDELFAGYDPIKALGPSQWYCRLVPKIARKGVRAITDMLPVSDRNMGLDFRLKRTLRGLAYPESVWLPTWMSPLESSEIAQLLEQPVSFDMLYADAIDAWNRSTATDITDKATEFFARFYLQDDILTKVDRASMMVSLEVRAPFLDVDLVEFARRLPASLKYKNGTTKYLLKKAYEGILPDNILYRSKKGFGIPLTKWLKEWEIPPIQQGMIQHNKIWLNTIISLHKNGKKDERIFLWAWLVLQKYLNKNH